MAGNKWFISDLHLGHNKIAALREYVSTEAHDIAVIQGLQIVPNKDILYILGDCFMNPKGDEAKQYMDQIPCEDIRLIKGNHDQIDGVKGIGGLFSYVYDSKMVKICGHNTWLHHYPTAYWPESHTGAFHLYGHVHGGREADLNRMMPGRRSMDVGVDRAMLHFEHPPMPFCDEYVYEMLINRPGHDAVKGISIAEQDVRARSDYELSYSNWHLW